MATDRIICKQCGNIESKNLEIIDEGKYVFCKICTAITPLYDKYDRMTIEGIVDKSQRLKSAKHLLFLKRYADAIDIYRKLTQDYSDSFEAWYGYAEALSQGFTTDLTGETKNALSAASFAADSAQQKSLLDDAESRLEQNKKEKLLRTQIEEDIKNLEFEKRTAEQKMKSLLLEQQTKRKRLSKIEQFDASELQESRSIAKGKEDHNSIVAGRFLCFVLAILSAIGTRLLLISLDAQDYITGNIFKDFLLLIVAGILTVFFLFCSFKYKKDRLRNIRDSHDNLNSTLEQEIIKSKQEISQLRTGDESLKAEIDKLNSLIQGFDGMISQKQNELTRNGFNVNNFDKVVVD